MQHQKGASEGKYPFWVYYLEILGPEIVNLGVRLPRPINVSKSISLVSYVAFCGGGTHLSQSVHNYPQE
jgi:hypothetical protein